MGTGLIRLLRWAGTASVLLALLPIAASAMLALAHGPVPRGADAAASALTARDVLDPTPARMRILLRSAALGGTAMVGAFLLALPSALLLATSRSRRGDAMLAPLVLWPLLAPPCVIAYAWTLLGTQSGWIGRGLRAIGWHAPQAALPVAGWIMANWLWPIPAFAMAAAYRRFGRPAMELACLDAPPRTAFVRAALPAMAGPLAVAACAVFLLAVQDATIPPLMLAPTVWSADMLVESTRAAPLVDPAGYLMWRSWPMLALIALFGVPGGLLGARLWRDRAELTHAEWSPRGSGGGAARALAFAAACLVSLLPIIVYAAELSDSPMRLIDRMGGVLLLYQLEIRATLLVAAISGLLGVAIGVALLGPRPMQRRSGPGRIRRWSTAAAAAALVAAAMLPPVVVGRSLIVWIDRPWGIPAGWHWHPYDDTPLAWVLGIVARFGFAPVLLALAARAGVPDELVHAARQDGASDDQVRRHVHLRLLWRPLLAGGLLLACLSLSEIQVASLVAPPRMGGSLAVTVDQQIHFGREGNVVAISLLLALPALVCSIVLACIWRPDSAADSRTNRRST